MVNETNIVRFLAQRTVLNIAKFCSDIQRFITEFTKACIWIADEPCQSTSIFALSSQESVSLVLILFARMS
jgi:hypothetical protein